MRWPWPRSSPPTGPASLPTSLQHRRLHLPARQKSREPAGPRGPGRPSAPGSQALEQEEGGWGGARAPHRQQGTPNAAPASDTHWPRQPRVTGDGRLQPELCRQRSAPHPVPTGRSSWTNPPSAVKPGLRWTGRGPDPTRTGPGEWRTRAPARLGVGSPTPSTDCPGWCAGHAPHQEATPGGSLHLVALMDSPIYWDGFPRGAGKGLVLTP